MWLLKSQALSASINETGGKESSVFYLLPGRKYLVGRKDCDIIISGDATISRKHGIISVQEKENGSGPSKLTIFDTSKAGIHLNGSTISPKQEVNINPDDVVGFGKTIVKFKFIFQSFHVVTSCLKKSEQKLLQLPLSKLGGKLCKEWSSEVTHLVMTKIVFTIKVVYALACGKFIVTPKYFEDLLDCCDQKLGKTLPEEKNYLPKIEEVSMMNMEALLFPNEKRGKLFAGKVFVFFNKKQYDRMKAAIAYSGGVTMLHEIKDNHFLKSIKSKQWIILQTEADDASQLSSGFANWIQELYRTLSKNGLRPIVESEIGLALINCSMEKFCNPAISNVDVYCTTANTQLFSQNTQSTSESFEPVDKKRLQTETQTKRKRNAASTSESSSNEASNVLKKAKVEQKTSNTSKKAKDGQLMNNQKSIGDDDICKIDESAFPMKSEKEEGKGRNIIEVDDDGFDFDEASITKTYHSPSKKVNSKKADVKNIIDIEDDSDDEAFQFDDTAFTSFSKPTKSDVTVLAKNTEVISPSNKTEGFSRKVVPETAVNTTTTDCVNESLDEETNPFAFNLKEKSKRAEENGYIDKEPILKENARTNDCVNESLDEEPNPFAFDVKKESIHRNTNREAVVKANTTAIDCANESLDEEPNPFAFGMKENSKRVEETKNSGRETRVKEDVDSKNVHDDTNDLEKRFQKAAVDSQTSDCLMDDLDDKCFEDDPNGDLDDLVSLDTPKLVGEDALISEEFPLVRKNNNKILDGWLATTYKISSDLLNENEENDEPRDLMQTAFIPLVINSNSVITKKVRQREVAVDSRRSLNSRSTKLFRKQFVMQETIRKTMIKSCDLKVYVAQDEERDNLFESFRQEYEQADAEQRKITEMFATI